MGFPTDLSKFIKNFEFIKSWGLKVEEDEFKAVGVLPQKKNRIMNYHEFRGCTSFEIMDEKFNLREWFEICPILPRIEYRLREPMLYVLLSNEFNLYVENGEKKYFSVYI